MSLLPDAGQEVLVIDNCPSTDATRRIVEGQQRVRYVREDRPGLNNARNRALRESSHEIVAFVDDDAAPDSGWLRALLHNFEDPLVYCVSGLTMPLELETDAQEMHERWSPFGRGYKRRVFDGVHCNPLAAGQVGAGANMALRRRVFTELGPFDEALDAGTITRSGGDTEMFARILINGYRIVYEPKALCWHRHRRTWKELSQMFYGHGVGVYAFLTRELFIQGEFGSPKITWDWFRYDQLPSLVRSLVGGRSSRPLDLILAELRGCLAGPWAYRTSRKTLAKSKVSHMIAKDPLPLISVIIPTHNRRASLERTLRALCRQSYPFDLMEVIVVADGCQDDTPEMLRTYAGPFRVQGLTQPHKGRRPPGILARRRRQVAFSSL